MINCRFPSNFRSVYWYDNVTDEDVQPKLTYKDSVKGGPGYDSGEFDIFRNGSLKIKQTSLLHEKTFKVICFRANEFYNVFYISVITTGTKVSFSKFILLEFLLNLMYLFESNIYISIVRCI